MDLKNLELNNPVDIKMIRAGYGEFPDTYKLTEEGIKIILEFAKQCFEAGFIAGTRSEFNGGFNQPDFNSYLKSLEND